MLTTPHTLVGLAIIKTFPHPLGLILSLISHFILDFCIPHWNPHLYTEMKKDSKISHFSTKIIFIDSFLAITFFLILVYQIMPNYNQIFLYILAVFFSTLPDLVKIPYYFFGYKNKVLAKYADFEHKYQADAGIFWGIATQILAVIASLKILLF